MCRCRIHTPLYNLQERRKTACVRASDRGVVESKVTALGYDPRFDLTAATWLLAGIAGTLDCILPEMAATFQNGSSCTIRPLPGCCGGSS